MLCSIPLIHKNPHFARLGNSIERVIFLTLAIFVLSACIEDVAKSFIEIPENDVFLNPRLDIGSTDSDFYSSDYNAETLSLLNVHPNHGPFSGGTKVLLSGSGFGKGLEVYFNDKRVGDDDIVMISPISVQVVAPPGEVGDAIIEIKRGPTQVKLPPGAYTYDPILLNPTSGPIAGGTRVTIESRGIELNTQTKLALGGKALTDVEVISQSTLRARTPAHYQGPADLVIGQNNGDITIREAFDYYQSTDQRNGGLGGGKIDGTLTVSVLNWLTRAPIESAKLVLVQDRKSWIQTSGSNGIALFTDKELSGTFSLTAGATNYQTSTIAFFDQQNVTIFLYPLIPPSPGTLPPGQRVPYVSGYVLFGGVTGAGLAEWKIVPEPKENQIKRVYVFTTSGDIAYASPPVPRASATIDFDPEATLRGWPYSMYIPTGNMAVYALAGLYNKQTSDFIPYAMGITRGVVSAPGDRLTIDVVVNIPLKEKLILTLENIPSMVDEYVAKLGINLGVDGTIILPGHEKVGAQIESKLEFGRLPAFSHPNLVDAYFSADVALYRSDPSGLPLSRSTQRLIRNDIKEINFNSFLGAPIQIKPNSNQAIEGNTLRFDYLGPTPDLTIISIETPDATPIWRVFCPGGTKEVKLPDPLLYGLAPWPEGPLYWAHWHASIDDYNFNEFTYRDLSSNVWKSWSFDQFTIYGPTQ